MAQWAGDPAGFGMQVEHGGFEAVVAQNDLQIAHKSAPLQGMCGIRVAQTVRGEPIQVAALCCRFDRPLDIIFMATPAHLFSGARVKASGP